MTKLYSALLLALVASHGLAQSGKDSLNTMKQMKVATTDLNLPTIAQTGRNADAIRNNLKKIKMPEGFKIDLFAIVPDARHMAIAPSTNMVMVGTRKTTVWAVTDRNSDGMPENDSTPGRVRGARVRSPLRRRRTSLRKSRSGHSCHTSVSIPESIRANPKPITSALAPNATSCASAPAPLGSFG
jgi:hypothetical protein